LFQKLSQKVVTLLNSPKVKPDKILTIIQILTCVFLHSDKFQPKEPTIKNLLKQIKNDINQQKDLEETETLKKYKKFLKKKDSMKSRHKFFQDQDSREKYDSLLQNCQRVLNEFSQEKDLLAGFSPIKTQQLEQDYLNFCAICLE